MFATWLRAIGVATLSLGSIACQPITAGRPVPRAPVAVEKPLPAGFGAWGEHTGMAPDWSLPQERRAPKLPGGGEVFRALSSQPRMAHLEDALLVCAVAVTREIPWDSFGPDLELRLEFGKAPAVTLWGPEDHWDMYVSVPRVTLSAGELVTLSAWDRDLTEKEFVGRTTVRFDGTLPLVFTPYQGPTQTMRMECRAMTAAAAERRAAPWLVRVDAALERARTAVCAPRVGSEPAPVRELHELESPWTAGDAPPLRYAAGFLGWEHPAIQARLARVGELEAGRCSEHGDGGAGGVGVDVGGDGGTGRARLDERRGHGVTSSGAPCARRATSRNGASTHHRLVPRNAVVEEPIVRNARCERERDR